MSYRKIVVDNIVYKYVVGKTHTKIVGIGVIKNTQIGVYFWRAEGDYETLVVSVLPCNIARYIKEYNTGRVITPYNICPSGYKLGDVKRVTTNVLTPQ